MLLTLLSMTPPPGPDICHLLGVCPTPPVASTASNLLYLATAFVVGAIIVHRTSPGKR
jgi:hypothetical protein